MTAALILATGDPLRPVGTVSALHRIILTLQSAGIERIVVAGKDCAALDSHVARMGVICLRNSNDEADGLRAGLRYLQDKCKAAFLARTDIPLFSAETLHALLAAPADAVIPRQGGQPGYPILLSASLFDSVIKNGLEALAPAYLDVPDEGILAHTQLRRSETLAQKHSLHSVRPDAKIYLAREKRFFGPGPYQLLRHLQETGSMRLACAQMGISYSKGWRMIDGVEQALGYAIVERQRGGAEKGRSSVTDRGNALLDFYEEYSQACKEQMQRLFTKHSIFD